MPLLFSSSLCCLLLASCSFNCLNLQHKQSTITTDENKLIANETSVTTYITTNLSPARGPSDVFSLCLASFGIVEFSLDIDF